ncbi:HpcH/HpaI aldolase/citrate lyase family protein [Sneathiella sp.]|uniref:HpcH/HpaI aldolase family protein n=1 Tax=Sneathiella sp. TaxID=1964365 RepID=UPI003565144E
MYCENKLKKKLQAGEKTTGCWLFSNSTDMAEIIAGSGFDAVMIDHEHGAGDLRSAIELHRAAASVSDITVLMRVPWNDNVMIKRALDTGVEGLMVPSVNTAEEAKAVVQACRYPPGGIRGSGLGVARAGGYGRHAADYKKNIDKEMLIICQIETKEAVGNIESIAAVEGVDMLFIGPNDLSGSINKLGEFDDPEVKALFAEARDKIKASPAFLGCISKGAEATNALFADGFDFLICAGDTGLMLTAANDLLGRVKK